MTEVVRLCWVLVGAYLSLGSLFSIAVHVRGLKRMDPGVQGTGVFFRLLITPGVIALWPLLALRWWQMTGHGGHSVAKESPGSPRRLRRRHALAWKALAVLGPAILALALAFRPAGGGLAPADPKVRTALGIPR